jgi:hypothetical protein
MDPIKDRLDFIARVVRNRGMAALLGSAVLSVFSPTNTLASEIVQSRHTDGIVAQVVASQLTPANEADTIKLLARRMEASPDYPMLFKGEDLSEVRPWFVGRKGWVLAEITLDKNQRQSSWVLAVYDGKNQGNLRERLSMALGASGGKVLDPAHALRDARQRVPGATMADVNRSVLGGADAGIIVSRSLWDLDIQPLSLDRSAGMHH